MKSRLEQQKINFKNLGMRLFSAQKLVLSQSTAYEVIAQFKQTKVRYYAAPNKRFKEPLVFVAPLAINMDIYDLYPYRSLIKHFQDSGFDVYLIDWGKLTYKNYQINFLSFIDKFIPKCIHAIQQHSQSEQISLHGWSMAGIFVTLYTARHAAPAVKNLIVLGSPIDSYASGPIGKLNQKMAALSERNQSVQDYMLNRLPKWLLHTPGFINSLGFKLLDPKGWLDSNLQLLKNIDNFQLVQEDATLSHFLNNMVDYPGGINQDMVLNVWLQNPLKQGAITLKDQTIELKKISCSLLVGAGKSDQMVTAASAKPLTELTSSQDVTFTLIPGGHLGLMSSQNSSIEFWPTLTTWLEQRSTQLQG